MKFPLKLENFKKKTAPQDSSVHAFRSISPRPQSWHVNWTQRPRSLSLPSTRHKCPSREWAASGEGSSRAGAPRPPLALDVDHWHRSSSYLMVGKKITEKWHDTDKLLEIIGRKKMMLNHDRVRQQFCYNSLISTRKKLSLLNSIQKIGW